MYSVGNELRAFNTYDATENWVISQNFPEDIEFKAIDFDNLKTLAIYAFK